MELNTRRFAVGLILVGGQLLIAGDGCADSWQHAVGVRISTEYETNPAMTTTQYRGVWQSLLAPSYTLTGRVGENQITAGATAQMARASNKTLVPDRDSPGVFFNWLRQYESGEFGIVARYAENTVRDAGGVEAAGRVSASSTTATRSLSGNLRSELDERSSLSADGAYEKVSYEGGVYTDYALRSAGLRYGYAMSEQVTAFVRVSGSKVIPAAGVASSRVSEGMLGVDWRLESWEWNLQAGKSWVDSGNSSTQGSISAIYTGPRSGLTLSAGRAVRPSGLGGFIKTVQVRGGWHYSLGEYTDIGFDLERQRNLSTTMNGDTTRTTSGAWMDHNLSAASRLRAYVQRRVSQGGGLESASSNMIGLAYVYADPDS